MSVKNKKNIKEGDEIKFISGNYSGLTGVIKKIDWNSKHKNAIFGFHHEVILSNGSCGFIEKSEHWEIV